MVKKVVCIGALLLALPYAMRAQEVKTDTVRVAQLDKIISELGDSTDIVVAGRSRSSNWFISGAIGMNGLAAEANREYESFIKRMQPMGQISVGKWFSPLWAFRFQVGAGKLCGHSLPFNFYNMFDKVPDHTLIPEEAKPYFSEKDGRTWFHRQFTYMDFQFNLMSNVVRWFTRDEEPVNFYLFVGPGFSHTFEKQGITPDNSFSLNAGAQLDVKLSDKLSLIAELQGTIVDESFDGQIGGLSSKKNRTVEGYGGLSIGITYKFGGQKFNRYTKVNPVVLESVYYTPAPIVVEVPAAEPELLVTEFPVRFLIDQSTIEEDQMTNIHLVVDYLREHPKARLKLSGYADKETAYPAYNMKLSERRVKAVKDCLVKEFNIDPDRLQTSAKGDIERAYEEDYRWNRAVVMEIIEDETENK